MDTIDIKGRWESVRQQLFRSQFWSNRWGIFGVKIVDGKGDLPEVDVLRINVAQRRWVLLLNQVFEDADIFVLRNFDSEHPIGIVAKNKAIE